MKAYIIVHLGFDFGPRYYNGKGSYGPINEAKMYPSIGRAKLGLRNVAHTYGKRSFSEMDRKFAVIEYELPNPTQMPFITPSSLWEDK